MSSYAQFMTPLIALQGISFASITGALRAATDAAQGINRRFWSMPIATPTPLAARMSASVYRCVIGLTVALICGHIIGFRFHRGVLYAVGFCVLVLLIGAVLSLLGDLIGTSSRSPEATTPVLLGPQLIFGLLSVGIQPVELFPRVDPADCPQSAHLPIRLRTACIGRRYDASGRICDMDGDEADVLVAGRPARGHAAGVGRRSREAAVMTIAADDVASGAELLDGAPVRSDAQPPENSLRVLVPQTLVQIEAAPCLVEPRLTDCRSDARCADPPPVDSEYCPRRTNLVDHRA